MQCSPKQSLFDVGCYRFGPKGLTVMEQDLNECDGFVSC